MAGAAPAGANSYQGLNEKNYRWSDTNGNVYTLTARLAIEVTSDGTQGRFRLRLSCTKFDVNLERPLPNSCLFQFDPATANAYWCFGTTGANFACYNRDLDNRGPIPEDLWYGTWHRLSNGVTYALYLDGFRAIFNSGNGHVGAWHEMCSYAWTKGGGTTFWC